MDVTGLSLSAAAALLRAGEVSSVQLTEAALQRTTATDGKLHAFLHVDAAGAMLQARAADASFAAWRKNPAGGQPAAVAGLPLAIKDVLCVAGLPATAGSRMLQGFIPPYDATAISRLRAAGAVFTGKTNTDEFAMGSSTENSGYGPTHNPIDLARVPGGSSGGSAAAVAARMAYGALGSDTGGSVRQPAALCGIVGLKPTYGRVSRYGLIAYGSSLDQVGPLARTVLDVALLLGAIAGHDPLDSTSLNEPVPDYAAALRTTSLSGLRVGVPTEYFAAGMQPEVEQAVRAAIEQLRALGALVRPVTLPHTAQALPTYYMIAPAEASANLARFDGVRYGPRSAGSGLWEQVRGTRGAGFGPEVKRRIMLGTYALSAGYYDAFYLRAQQARTLIKRDFEAVFKDVDVLACATTPTTAFKLGEKVDDPLTMYLSDVFTLAVNLAGLPAISLPCGLDAGGLPIGLQLIGPVLSEVRLLQVAQAYEQAAGWQAPQLAV